MHVRTNYEQGIYRSRHLNRIQRWSLMYYLYTQEVKEQDIREDYFKFMTLITNMDLYKVIFDKKNVHDENYVPDPNEVHEEFDDLGDGSGDFVVSVHELDEDEELIAYLATLGKQETMVVGTLADDEGWQ